MNLVDLPISSIAAAPWNPNDMDHAMRSRLAVSIERFGPIIPLVVRLTGDSCFETVGGAQRLSVLRELGVESVSCVLVEADDARARLLAQALNRIQGQDNPGLKAALLEAVLRELSQEEVLDLLPETTASLQALGSLSHEDLATHLRNWQRAQESKLASFSVRLTREQASVVESAVSRFLSRAAETPDASPNRRGTALYLLCQQSLDQEKLS